MSWFNRYREAVTEAFGEKETSENEEKIEAVEQVEEQPEEEWVWVTGYKGTEKDMKCNDFQYELGGKYSMPKDEVVECASGFHLCKELRDVYKYYAIVDGRRYFKVRALVKKADLDRYGQTEIIDSSIWTFTSRCRDKLVAAEIEFLEELSLDDVFKPTYASDWSEKHKKLALEIGLDGAAHQRRIDILNDLGYSSVFAQHIVNSDKFRIAEAVGSQSDLSMDMKVWTIFNT